MAYKVIILYQLYMPSYFLGTFTEYPYLSSIKSDMHDPIGKIIKMFQFYLSSIKSSEIEKIIETQQLFQFYLSSIKSIFYLQ